MFAHVDKNHPQHVALWLGELFGGPARYTEERGGYAAMLRHHIDLQITTEQRS